MVADAIEAQEFPDLARRYRVTGVPRTVVNDTVEWVGAVSEEEFIGDVLRAAGVPPGP